MESIIIRPVNMSKNTSWEDQTAAIHILFKENLPFRLRRLEKDNPHNRKSQKNKENKKIELNVPFMFQTKKFTHDCNFIVNIYLVNP